MVFCRLSGGTAPQTNTPLPPEERSEFRGLPTPGSLAGFPSGRPGNKSGGSRDWNLWAKLRPHAPHLALNTMPGSGQTGVEPSRGSPRSGACGALDGSTPVWRPAWQGFQGWVWAGETNCLVVVSQDVVQQVVEAIGWRLLGESIVRAVGVVPVQISGEVAISAV